MRREEHIRGLDTAAKGKISMAAKTDDLARFYAALNLLESGVGGKRRLSHCDGRMSWPKRGVYFFFEHGESRSGSGNGSRVVRVGTHAVSSTSSSGTTLWSRLSQHRGVASTGKGNHRGSVFRQLLGLALIERYPECSVATWGEGDSAPKDVREEEIELEQQVSQMIGEMPFLWLEIDDPPGPGSHRRYIEKNAIALLSGYNRPHIDPPSDSWLGLHCPRGKVRNSGLWNQRHVKDDYDPGFLSEFENLVARQTGKGN